ncbi:e3 ubiquitin- ligase ari9 [Fusarium longipes]|uniref:RBR-type E3 ubiquitin transferase n=1 Tax=Fusarium longipes TaxID=694270 RepID=A0A395SSC6_9HYPO|nr:e3 ubiquitin- ligase ari9 [Fusarium longipes]
MPGAFGPEDYIDFYESPLEVLQNLESAWINRETRTSWSINNSPALDDVDFDWRKYDPPSTLRKAPNITSQVLLDVLQSSIDNVKAKNIEYDRQKKEAEAQRHREENEKGKNKEPYLPIIIPVENLVQDDKRKDIPKTKPDILMTTFGPSVEVTTIDVKANKKRLVALRRFFQRSNETGESSAIGATLSTLQKVAGGTDTGRESLSLSNKPNTVDEVYCHDCFIRLVSAACHNEQQWPPKCCLNEIPSRTVLRFIPPKLKKTFEERSKEWELPVSERVYCSDPNCSLWIKPQRIDPSRRRGVCDRSHPTCTLCRGRAHDGEECPQDVDMNLTNQLAEDEGWKRCSKCHALVEHREACQHMTCRCGNQFCYVCERRWRTCDCTMEQLQAVKDGAAARREERQASELAEAEEIRQALLQIEEFEREEALKAELLRQEEERLEEERRQRELEERVRQESIRRRDIEIKYQELRVLLDQLHELQQVLLDVDQEKEGENMIISIKSTKDDLEKKHDLERSELSVAILKKTVEKEQALNRDFQIRAAQENDLEQAYHERLKAYWKDKKDGDQQIETAMLDLRKRMDQKQHAWQKWKDEQLNELEAKLQDNRTYREELMYSAKHRLDDACKENERDMVRRMAAEKKWLEAVVLEREKLLSERELEEVEGDADSIFAPESDGTGDEHYVVATAL